MILIVEDHDDVRISLRMWLGDVFRDDEIIEATNGVDAVEQALAHAPDIVVMDISMPEMNGIEATRKIKTALPHSQIAVLSVHDTPEYRSDALDAGASVYIPKSQAYMALIPALNRLLSERTAGST